MTYYAWGEEMESFAKTNFEIKLVNVNLVKKTLLVWRVTCFEGNVFQNKAILVWTMESHMFCMKCLLEYSNALILIVRRDTWHVGQILANHENFTFHVHFNPVYSRQMCLWYLTQADESALDRYSSVNNLHKGTWKGDYVSNLTPYSDYLVPILLLLSLIPSQ